jgi:hypothetical protein
MIAKKISKELYDFQIKYCMNMGISSTEKLLKYQLFKAMVYQKTDKLDKANKIFREILEASKKELGE